jgi:hypothetical protein
VVILPPQIIIIIATMTTKIIKNIGGGPEWSFTPGPPDTFARPWHDLRTEFHKNLPADSKVIRGGHTDRQTDW